VTVGVFRPKIATFYLRNANAGGAADMFGQFGAPTDIPVIGDWDANGTDTVGIWRAGGDAPTFMMRNSNTAGAVDLTVKFGEKGDVPVAGNWDGK